MNKVGYPRTPGNVGYTIDENATDLFVVAHLSALGSTFVSEDLEPTMPLKRSSIYKMLQMIKVFSIDIIYHFVFH